MKRKTRLLWAGLLGLSACSSFHPVPEPEPTFTDQYVRELAGLPATTGSAASNVYVSDDASFRALALRASSPGAASDVIGLYLKTGFALDDMYCMRYFEKLTHDQALLESAKTQTALTGGLTSALMGIFNAGSAATGAVGAGFAFLTASMDNVNTSFLLTPNIESIHDLVTSTHVSMVSNMPKFDNFPDAHVFLLRYVRVCTFAGIKDLIDRSVKTSVPSADASGQISMNVVSAAAAAAGASGTVTSNVVAAAANAAASAASAAQASAASAAAAVRKN